MGNWLIVGSGVAGAYIKIVQSSDHVTPFSGTPGAVTVSVNGGAFFTPSGTLTEIGNGWYVLPIGSETSSPGFLILSVASGGSNDPASDVYPIYELNPLQAVNAGLTALPTVPPGSLGGLIFYGSGAGGLSPTTGLVELTAAARAAILAGDVLPEAYPADGSPGKLNELLYLLVAALTQFDIIGTSLQTRKLDGTTAGPGYLLNDATSPTARTRVS